MDRITRICALLAILVAGCAQPPLVAATPRIGMNLAGLSYYSRETPFLDRMKSAPQWRMAGQDNVQPPTDAKGNLVPGGVPAGQTVLTIVPVEKPDPKPFRYVMTFRGKAQFDLTYARTISSKPGRIVFDFEGSGDALWMPMKATITDANDPPRDFHVVREDQAALFAKGEVFNPQFLAMAKHWSVLRMMDWTKTNDVHAVDWAKRAQVDEVSWLREGVPLEILVRLANEADTDLWFNVPFRADDAWVREAMTLIKGSLNPKRRLYVEFSNEVWNFGMGAAHAAQEEGNKLWGKDANKDGKIDKGNPAENFGAGWTTWYGLRSAQVAKAAQSVFTGDDARRLRTVISTQTGWLGLETSIFDGVSRARVGDVSSLFTDYAVTTYFGGDIGSRDKGPDVDKVAQWARTGETGMVAALDHLRGGGGLASDNSLAKLKTELAYQGRIAAQHKLALVAYEGGAHTTALLYPDQVKREVVGLNARLMNDPRMGQLYDEMVRAFGEAGGQLLCVYNDVGSSSQWGYFGILDTISQPTSARFEAMKAAAERGKADRAGTVQVIDEGR